MSYTLHTLDDDHIIVMTMQPDFDIEREAPRIFEECLAIVEAGPDQVVVITDSRSKQFTSFQEILGIGQVVSRGPGKAIADHPKVVKRIALASSQIARLAVKGLNSATFGFIDISICETLEEALDIATAALSMFSAAA